MKLSMEKFLHFITTLNISDAKFAESIGVSKNALYKMMARKAEQEMKSKSDEEIKEKELPTSYAIRVMQKYKIDFSYFYDDSIAISSNPINEHPQVDNKRVKSLEKNVEEMNDALYELTKKFEESNSSNIEIITDIANDVINEFISATIKLDKVSKNILASNIGLKTIIDISDRTLINYANRKALDFIQMINNLDKKDFSSISNVMKKVYEFKLENTTYLVQINNCNSIISKQNKIIPYANMAKKLAKQSDDLSDKIENIDDKELADLDIELYWTFMDYLNILDYCNIFLVRDLINNLEFKELEDCLKPIVKDVFYDDNNKFTMSSNPKTLERISKAVINLIDDKDPIKDIYNEFNDIKSNMEKMLVEKGFGDGLC